MRVHVVAAACLLGLAAAALAWSQKVGEVVYVEGDVLLVRNGEEMENVQIGQDLQNFDLIRTGADGLAELSVSAPAAPRMTLKISPKTQFSLEIAKAGKKQQTTVGLLTGTVALKVSRLAGSQAVTVRTESTAMGVRGTEFTVTSPPSGDILVTCDEGEVVCEDEDAELAAVPGTAVEKRARGAPAARGPGGGEPAGVPAEVGRRAPGDAARERPAEDREGRCQVPQAGGGLRPETTRS